MNINLLMLPFLLTGIEMVDDKPSEQSIIWYKSLSIEQKIDLKELSTDICGITFDILIRLFNFKGAISLLHEKLLAENLI